jgi:hypothetical protein
VFSWGSKDSPNPSIDPAPFGSESTLGLTPDLSGGAALAGSGAPAAAIRRAARAHENPPAKADQSGWLTLLQHLMGIMRVTIFRKRAKSKNSWVERETARAGECHDLRICWVFELGSHRGVGTGPGFSLDFGSILRERGEMASGSVGRLGYDSGTCRENAGVKFFLCLVGFFYCFQGLDAARAQGTFRSVSTGAGQPLATLQASLSLVGAVNPVIAFDFGFVTREVQAPGAFLDSFTVSVQDGSSSLLAVLATLDASGAVWAPTTPGTLPVTEAQIVRWAMNPPSQPPVGGQGMAFSVTLPVPQQFTGQSLDVYFDLFDNLDPLLSVGWYDHLRIVSVPEPQSCAVLGLGVGLGLLTVASNRRKNREKNM